MKDDKVEMYPALAMLIVRRAISASKEEFDEAVAMIMAGPQPGQNYYGPLGNVQTKKEAP